MTAMKSKNRLKNVQDPDSQLRVLTSKATDVAYRKFEDVAIQCSASTQAMLGETDRQ